MQFVLSWLHTINAIVATAVPYRQERADALFSMQQLFSVTLRANPSITSISNFAEPDAPASRCWSAIEKTVTGTTSQPMRIAQVAPLAESVPPKLYGGTERVVAWLSNELIELGHDVTLFASGDSVTRASLVPVWPRALRLGRPRADPAAALAALLEAVARQAANFDVIHCHIDWTHLPLLSRLNVPFVTTMHNRLDTPGLSGVMGSFPEAAFISISNDQRAPCPQANWLATVYHGLPPDSLQPRFEAGSYLAFLGRLSPDKGPEKAIEIR